MDKVSKKKIERLQLISQEINGKSHQENIREACEAGVKWIQLRVKNKAYEEIKKIALEVREICNQYGVTYIVNDNPVLAKEVNADGVHLGSTDMAPLVARQLLGDKVIIGGTCNSWKDVLYMTSQGVDYIGIGPYRHTSTKEKLSPILGLEGYREIITRMQEGVLTLPIIAIGGIIPEDIKALDEIGISGVAIASAINTSSNKKVEVDKFIKLLSHEQHIESRR